MTNYFKVYITNFDNGKTAKIVVKTSQEVREIIGRLKNGKYQVVKRIKQSTDVPVALGSVHNGVQRVLSDQLDTDYRVVGNNVVDYTRYKKAQEDQERWSGEWKKKGLVRRRGKGIKLSSKEFDNFIWGKRTHINKAVAYCILHNCYLEPIDIKERGCNRKRCKYRKEIKSRRSAYAGKEEEKN